MAAEDSANPGSASRRRGNTATSVAQSVSSLKQGVANTAGNILNQDAPLSFWAAAGTSASQAPDLLDIRRGSFGADGWRANEQAIQRTRRLSSIRSSTDSRKPKTVPEETTETKGTEPFPPLQEEELGLERTQEDEDITAVQDKQPPEEKKPVPHRDYRALSTGYIPPPPALPWTTSTWIGLKAFFKWAATPLGFFITVYSLNVVAWGGMLFLLLCNASPAMCWPPVPSEEGEMRRTPVEALKWVSTQPRYFDSGCNDINSPRRIWLEIDSQILNALFCVTGFGLVPWRFRDLFYLLRYRLTSARRSGVPAKLHGLRTLAGIQRTWFRLPGSPTLDEMSAADYERSVMKQNKEGVSNGVLETGQRGDIRIPIPTAKCPSDPLTGVRAPATPTWKMDFFVWCNVWNTFFQIVLCVFMWRFDRYDRPSWATGLFIALACIIAGAGGIVSFVEGKKVKRVEGVPAKNVQPSDLNLEQFPTQHEEIHASGNK